MADLEQRETYEEELMSLLLILWGSEGILFWSAQPPRLRYFREQFRRHGVDDLIDRVTRQQSRAFLDEIDLPQAVDGLDRRRENVSEQYLHDLARRLLFSHAAWQAARDVARRQVVPEIELPPMAEPSTAEPSTDETADEIYSDHQSRREAITSLTQLVTDTEINGRDYVRDHHGIEVESYWTLDPRSNWCQACLRLADTPERIWSIEAPSGPPQHPNCCCYLSHVPIYGIDDDADGGGLFAAEWMP